MISLLEDLIAEFYMKNPNQPERIRLDYNSYRALIKEFNGMMMPYNRIEENGNSVISYRGIKVELIPEVYDGITKIIIE